MLIEALKTDKKIIIIYARSVESMVINELLFNNATILPSRAINNTDIDKKMAKVINRVRELIGYKKSYKKQARLTKLKRFLLADF